MRAKKKLSAIFAILMITVSFFAVVQFPVQAQPPVPMVAPRDMAFRDPGTGAVTPSPGTLPMNLTYQHIVDPTLLGKLLIAAIYLVPPAGGVNLSSYKVGFTYNPAVLRVVKDAVYNVSLGAPLPPTVFEGTGKPAVMTPGEILNYWGNVTSYNVTLTTPGDYVPVAAPTPLLYVIFLINYYGESNIGFTTAPVVTQTALADQNGPIFCITADGYWKYGIHEVTVSPGLSPYFGDDCTGNPYGPGDNITITVSIKNTEPLHSWEINISYNPAVLSVPSPALVIEGSYLQAAFPGYTTFSSAVGTGWVWANCTLDPGLNRTGDGLIMLFIAYLVGYGVSPLIITSFNAVDNYGNTIPNLELIHTPTDVTKAVQFEKIPIIAVIDAVTGLPLMGQPGTPGPGMWTYPAHNISDTFTVALTLLNTTQNVNSWKAGFRFNPRVLQVVGIAHAGYIYPSTNVTGTIDNVSGIVSGYNQTGVGGAYGTGPGALLYVTFHVVDYGLSEIELTDADVDWQTKLLDLAGKEIKTPAGLVFATDDISPEFEFRAPVTVGIGSTTVKFGDTFTLNITIDTMENITAWNIGFRFDPAVLEVTAVTEGPFLSSVGATEWKPATIDNVNGIVYSHGCSLYAGNWTKGTGVLATIEFKVVGYGETAIELTLLDEDPAETIVLDPDGEECVYVTLVNGYFKLLPGDLDGDRNVDQDDFVEFGGYYPTSVVDPVSAKADFDGDGDVDQDDFVIFGGYYPTPFYDP